MTLINVKNYLPPAPKGVNPQAWFKSQSWLINQFVPKEIVAQITELRQINLWVHLIKLGHDWRFIAENEYILIDRNFKRKPGQN
jgi:hypothetical protein